MHLSLMAVRGNRFIFDGAGTTLYQFDGKRWRWIDYEECIP